MNDFSLLSTYRVILAGAFGLAALVGGIALECMSDSAPPWLVAIISLSAGYVFGHVQNNGLRRRNDKQGT